MSSQEATFITPPNPLKGRVCDVDDGVSLEELFARSEAIVERTAAQWRLGAFMNVEFLVSVIEALRLDPCELGTTLPLFFRAVRDIEEQASELGFPDVQKAAATITGYLAGIDAEGGNLGDPARHISMIELSIDVLQAQLVLGSRDRAPDVDWLLAAA